MKQITEADLVDYLAGELPTDRHQSVAEALTLDPALQASLRELEILMEDIATTPEPAPSAAADARFAEMLAAVTLEQDTTAQKAPGKSKLRLAWANRALRFAATAAAVALVFAAGMFYGGYDGIEDAANRTLLEEMADLMDAERTSDRIKATTVTLELEQIDPTTTKNLGYLLRNDKNANVRLAALAALRRFPQDPVVREELLAAMKASPPDVVRFELIETLVRMNEKRVLPYLEDIIDTDTLPQPVRDAAEMASFKLI
ncbi:MAG: HEAT repeat domain-containing protein [Bacteroidota bacterium]